MTAAALKSVPVLRTSAGEPPLGRDGQFFRDDQGIIFEHDNERYRSASTKIGILELENGKWLAQPPSFRVDAQQYDSRDHALRAGIARLIRRSRKYQKNGEGDGTHWSEGYAGRVREWAWSLKPAKALKPGPEYRALLAIDGGHKVAPAVRDALLAAKLIERIPGAPGQYQLSQAGLKRMGLDEEDLVQGTAADASPLSGHPGTLQVCANPQTDPNACLAAGVTDDASGTLAGEVNQNTPSEEITPPANPNNVLGVKTSSEEINPAHWSSDLTHEMANEELTIAGYEASDAGAGLSDPVVKYLVEQHALRKQFPAKHVFSMTTDVADGRVVAVATCACKQIFRFGSNDHLRMNAAIEAHWRRFSHEKIVDGRGQPIEPGQLRKNTEINAEEGTDGSSSQGTFSPTKKRSRRSAPKAGREVQPANAALPEPASVTPSVEDSGSHLSEAGGKSQPQDPAPVELPSAGAGEIVDAQICAADTVDWDDPFIKAAVALAWRDEVEQPDPVEEFERALPQLMGPEEKRRKVAEYKLALRQKPVNLGPLFGAVPPPLSTTAVGKLTPHD